MASNFLLVAQREYVTRVRKRAFLILTLLVPLLIAGFGAALVYIAKSDSAQADTVAVLDESGLGLANLLVASTQVRFVAATGPLAAAKQQFQKAKQDGLLYLPAGLDVDNPQNVQFFGKGNISLKKELAVESALDKLLSELRMRKSGITQQQMERLRAKVSLQTVSLGADGKEASNNALATSAIAYVLAILIYMFIFLYGVQIMRGVGEEKSSRIMEVMLSSVKPFDLMMGKIVGIAAVGLTQFLLWGVLSFGASSLVGALLVPTPTPVATGAGAAAGPTAATSPATGPTAATTANTELSAREKLDQQAAGSAQALDPNARLAFLKPLKNLPLGQILFGFIAYFLGGYLLYGALFGAIGAAVDEQTDAQQFMFPITLPLILSYVIGLSVILRNPDGPVAFWMSMVPFTSPIAMVIRLPFGVPGWQLALSLGLLVLGFVGTTWVAARIYRVGVLMYGKKITYRELSKWMFYKG